MCKLPKTVYEMKGNYLIFREEDLKKSQILKEKLKINDEDYLKIENWFETLLIEHSKCEDFKEQHKIEKIIETNFFNLISSEIEQRSYKYILPKLLSYSNIFWTGFLRSLHIARLSHLLQHTLIPKLMKLVNYNVYEFHIVTEYLRNNIYVSPNSELLEKIILIEKDNKIFNEKNSQLNLEILRNILNIISEKGFHHDIICFKKLIKRINSNDILLINCIKEFTANNKQGCYLIISEILNQKYLKNIENEFIVKIFILDFLDSARGGQPKESWCKKLSDLKMKLDNNDLLELINIIKSKSYLNRYKFEDSTIWTDDVADRFIKSVNWIENKACT